MNPAFDRARILFDQRRYDLAEREFQNAISEDPTQGVLFAFLAACMSEQGQNIESTDVARKAIELAPDVPYCHYTLSLSLFRRNRFEESRTAIEEAIRLDPDEALYLGELAITELKLDNWNSALEVAERGLAINPYEANCNTVRVRALHCLGKMAESNAAAKAALEQSPDSALAHTNLGWNQLQSGESAEAIAAFREALRINPLSEWARDGLIEGLRRTSRFYRAVKAYMGATPITRGEPIHVVVIVLLAIYLLVDLTGDEVPTFGYQQIAVPIVGVFLILSWLSKPLANALLWTNSTTRILLKPNEIKESASVCILVFAALVAIGVLLAAFSGTAAVIAVAFAGTAILNAIAFKCSVTRIRFVMFIVATAYLFAGFYFAYLVASAPPHVKGQVNISAIGMHSMLLSLFVADWAGAALSNRKQRY